MFLTDLKRVSHYLRFSIMSIRITSSSNHIASGINFPVLEERGKNINILG